MRKRKTTSLGVRKGPISESYFQVGKVKSARSPIHKIKKIKPIK
jgi:hypothetical protein